ncbi:MAG TPA: 50S ribosomal protein L4 [Paenibacillus sp.]|uniref:50S ribosomal protein L4 n=1 Tax=Paenibacillus TaxID=44249 RepID=UPI000B9FAB22|nr:MULTISPECIES: 50S ribosomal protein L4 [Paenibacillus]OZQ60438.1 50S ribosomal protein L4 [Paenibacillus taichungensis]HBU82415.1 50S ribosomal protein L4 [Paenibacillus sp.]
MLKVNVFDMEGNIVDEMELEESIFGINPNESVMHEAVVNYLANKRRGTQSALTRGEVRGGGRKPYKQNKIDRSRAGSIRMPHWRGGGVVFAPKPRDYSYKLNKKVKQLAIKSALSSKVQNQELIVVDEIKLENYRTKSIVSMLNALGVNKKSLIVKPSTDPIVFKSANNIPYVETAVVDSLNVYTILNYEKLIITKEAVNMITEIYSSF